MTDCVSPNDLTHTQKPNALDSPVYEKPNVYDDDEQTRVIYDRPHEKDEQEYSRGHSGGGNGINTVVAFKEGDHKRPVSPDNDDDDDDQSYQIPNETSPRHSTASSNSMESFVTASVLSQAPSATTEITVNDELAQHVAFMSLRHHSYTPSLSNISPSTSTSSRDSSRQHLILHALDSAYDTKKQQRRKSRSDVIVYDFSKKSLTKPQIHEIKDQSKNVVYRKEQEHSYSWGFQNVLYKDDTKVAQAYRKAFHKDIIVECSNDTQQTPLVNRTKSHLLFVYETQFDGLWIRWKRPSLLSHDLTCEVAAIEETQPGEERRRRHWKLLAEFDSHRMGYLIQLGRLVIDRTGLELFENTEALTMHLVITCSTLVDLMREVVEKAVGLGDGGVAGSD